MKHYADQKRRDYTYHIGDLVYVKLRPYRQQSVSGTIYSKLSKRYYGPYKIIEQMGPVAFKLDLPPHAKIHPVFHCSLLKPHHGSSTFPSDELPPLTFNNQPIIQPLSILETKLDQSTSPPHQMVLVQWQGLAPEDTSWENWQELSTNYHLEDKVVFPAAGSDTNDTHMGRPKRNTARPIRLNDYVT